MTASVATVEVIDRFGVATDEAMPFLKQALDPTAAEHHVRPLVEERYPGAGSWLLRSINVVRHKPGRRCLVEYRFESKDGKREVTLIGKARAKSTDRSTYRTMQALWNAGFDDQASDGVMIPEPIGVVPEFQMWLQRKVPGIVSTRLLAAPAGDALAERITEAARKLHHAGVPAKRRHTPSDEMDILRKRLEALAANRPDLAPRLHRTIEASTALAADLPILDHGIHRDFYPDQVLVDGPHLYLLDLDLYAAGDPALDIGNFIGHLIEQGLREPANAGQLAAAAQAMETRYLTSGDASLRRAIQIYTTLTLARHISISTQFPERRHITERLLELCEHRLHTIHAPITSRT